MINDDACIIGAGHAYRSKDLPIIKQPLTCKGPTIIDAYVEIGKEVTILDGVRIGKKARVLAKSFVRNDIAPNCTASGAPASPC